MFNEDTLSKYINSPSEFLFFCHEIGILQKKFRCQICKKDMHLERTTANDGFRWRCLKVKCGKKTISIRKNSVFENIRCSIFVALRIIYKWSQFMTIKQIKIELKIGKKIIKSVLKIFYKILKKKFSEKIGGNNKIIEIDETALSKRKYNKGRSLRTIWCIGGIERKTNKVFFTTSLYRNSKKIDAIIEKYVEKESTIYTDMWRGYKNLSNLGYNHKTVNHSENFLNPIDRDIHTQKIEVTWRWLKNYLKKYPSIKKKNLNFLIRQYFYLKSIEGDFEKILLDIKHKKFFN